jgi:hypothetical protein
LHPGPDDSHACIITLSREQKKMLGANWGNLHAQESIVRYDAFFIIHRELTKDLLTA